VCALVSSDFSAAVIDINIINVPGLSLSCIRPTNIYMSFLAAIGTPAILVAFLLAVYTAARVRLVTKASALNSGLRATLPQRLAWLSTKMMTLLLWVTLLLYPTVSRTIFQVRCQ
jgi:hypothetical protein